MTDWAAHEAGAQALRRLNGAFSGFEADQELLRAISNQAHELAVRLERGRPRDKIAEMSDLNVITADDGELPRTVAVGERFEFDPFSPCGGRLHPSALDLELRRDGETSIVGTVTVDPMFQGPPGRVHGGIVALILDEVMGSLNRATGQRAFTARLALDLRSPAPVSAPLTFRAWLREKRGRKITIAADGRTEEAVLFVQAEALFVESDLQAQ